MYVFRSLHTNPFFNAALEEYLFREMPHDEFLLLYKNEPSVIIGKHQNALAEISFPYMCRNRIAVVRRMSGGGAVYHDPGNINFTIIRNFNHGSAVPAMNTFLEPVCNILIPLGLDVSIGEKNDIRVSGKKVSGNAWHIYKNRVLHHGTLLFNAATDALSKALSASSETYVSSAVTSNRTSVTNLAKFFGSDFGQDTFESLLLERFHDIFTPLRSWEPSDRDYAHIFELMASKYLTWDWNFAYSPPYEFSKKTFANGNELNIYLKVEKGIIVMSNIRLNGKHITEQHNPLFGLRHNDSDIRYYVTKNLHLLKTVHIRINELVYMFF